MQSIYRLKANELNADLIESLKLIFKDQEIEIIVSAVDETEYLFRSPVNKQRLLDALSNIENQENLVEVSIE